MYMYNGQPSLDSTRVHTVELILAELIIKDFFSSMRGGAIQCPTTPINNLLSSFFTSKNLGNFFGDYKGELGKC